MSVLGNIQGLQSAENISTEIVAYFLSPEEGIVPFQRLFFSHILGSPSSSKELDIQIRTQVDLGKTGIPDFVLLGGDGKALVILENKLGSYLSGETQLLRYAEAFKKEREIKLYFNYSLKRSSAVSKRVLVLLAPKKALEISMLTTDEAFKKRYHTGFRKYLDENEIEFRTIEWEKVIGWLDKRDSFQNELFRFVEDFLSLELTEGEEMALQDPEIPIGLQKLFRNISAIANEVAAKKWIIGRMTQSYLWYGFNIETDLTRLYFGYSIPLWLEFGTPVILRATDTEFKLDRNLVSNRLIENGFVYGKGNQLIRAFKIESMDCWKRDLLDILDKLRSEQPSPL
jgi:hypothetical protein